jgi:transposase
MGRPSRFDEEFRAHAVELVRVSQKPRRQIAADLGVSDTTLSKWMSSSREKSGKERELSVSEREELEQLRTEKREWVVERDILKKATAFWVKESRG